MAATASPPKPWERAGAGASYNASTTSPTLPGHTTSSASATNTTLPDLPARPSSLDSVVNRTASNYAGASPYGASRFGASPYGYGGMSSYSSPYSRMGGYGYGGGAYGAGGYGAAGYGGYGGLGGGMYGGGMYGNGMGMPGVPGQEQSLTQSFSQSTQATFQIIESIVGAFGGFAQMLESTYMATHSSFFAMVSVAEQFGNLRNTLGSVLGIFAIIRWAKSLLAKITGRPPPASSTDLTPANFHQFSGRAPDGSPAPPRASKKPFIIFLLTAFGLPYLMGKLIRSLAASQEAEAQRALQQQQPLDPSKLDFCRVLYDFTPDPQPGDSGLGGAGAAAASAVQGVDLSVRKGDLVAVLSKLDPLGGPSEWWLCRARDGRKGYLPKPYLEIIARPGMPQQRPQSQIAAGPDQQQSQQRQAGGLLGSGSPDGSRIQTMTSEVADFASRRPNEIVDREKELVRNAPKSAPAVQGRMGDLSVESFQRGWANNS